jgi:hypothetical protein
MPSGCGAASCGCTGSHPKPETHLSSSSALRRAAPLFHDLIEGLSDRFEPQNAPEWISAFPKRYSNGERPARMFQVITAQTSLGEPALNDRLWISPLRLYA